MSITNKLNQIKNAIYGKEVRGAIHDAIKECYDDASVNHDNANMEVKMARGTHNTLNDRLDNVDEIQAQTNAQLSKITITPEFYGAIGDGVTDDTEAFKTLFKNLCSGCVVILGDNKTYCISNGGFNCFVDNVKVIGNNATIKIKDNSGYINNLLYGNADKNIFNFFSNGITIENLNFDGNIENNFIQHNGSKYYGVHPDLNIDGLPKNFASYNFINFVGSGLSVKNCSFYEVSGTGINTGITDRSIITKNVEVSNCIFYKSFRAALSLFHTSNSKIHHCIFKENQRHNIQFYTGCEDGEVYYNTITCNVDEIPIWYPSWTPASSDSERIGVSIAHPSYSDKSKNFRIEKNTIHSVDTQLKGLIYGVALRNYPENVVISENDICVKIYPIFINRGFVGALDIRNNKLKAEDFCFYLIFGRTNYPPVNSSEVISNISMTGNDLSAYRILMFEGLDDNVGDYYKKLNFLFENNTLHNSRVINGVTMSSVDTKNPVIDFIYNNNAYGENELYMNKYIQSKKFTIRPQKLSLFTARKEDFPGCHYLKIGKISGIKNQHLHLKGHLISSGITDKGRYAEFMMYVRLNHTLTSNDLSAITLIDVNSKNIDPDYFIVINSYRDEETNDLYLYIKCDNLITVNIDDISGNCTFTLIDDQKWYSDIDVPIIRKYQTQ